MNDEKKKNLKKFIHPWLTDSELHEEDETKREREKEKKKKTKKKRKSDK